MPAVCTHFAGEILDQAVGVDVKGVGVIGGPGDDIGVQDRQQVQRRVDADLGQVHGGKVVVEQASRFRRADQHDAAR